MRDTRAVTHHNKLGSTTRSTHGKQQIRHAHLCRLCPIRIRLRRQLTSRAKDHERADGREQAEEDHEEQGLARSLCGEIGCEIGGEGGVGEGEADDRGGAKQSERSERASAVSHTHETGQHDVAALELTIPRSARPTR